MNLPNKLTVVRVLMIPFFVWFMLPSLGGEMAASKWIALAIFCIASLTDLLDGKNCAEIQPCDKFRKIYGSAGRQTACRCGNDLSCRDGKTSGVDRHCDYQP